MDIMSEFGQRVRELRARSGMSQETLAHRAALDRTYISGVERGMRNISLVNIEKISAALNVSVGYMFSRERFSVNPAYLQKDFAVPFLERFKYHLDADKKILAFQFSGLFSGQEDVEYVSSTLLGICSSFGKGELNIFVDHREMKSADGEPAVYSPEVAERAVAFQKSLNIYSKKVIVLCNSEFMVQQLNHVTAESGIQTSIHLFGKDRDMIGEAYELLDIHGNEIIRAAQ